MGETRWVPRIRAGIAMLLAVVLIVALAGIVATGPIVVGTTKMEVPIQLSAERLERDVLRLCGEFAPRDHTHPENLARAAAWIADELRQAGLEVELQEYEAGGERYFNVIGRHVGIDPAAGALVVGAHYDAVEGSPGADDNASGVAALLELARTRPQPQVRATRYFVAFSTGEPPYFDTEQRGSRVFAADLVARQQPVELMISLDAVGYYSTTPRSQTIPLPVLRWLYSHKADWIAVVGDLRAGPSIRRVKQYMRAARALPVESFRAPARWAPVLVSDHASFRELGLPGVLVTDTAFYRNPSYHTPQDTPETLDTARLRSVVRALHGVLWDAEVAAASPP